MLTLAVASLATTTTASPIESRICRSSASLRRRAASDAARYAYSRDATENQSLDGTEQFGLRLRRGVLELQIGASGWQALTDAGVPRFASYLRRREL